MLDDLDVGTYLLYYVYLRIMCIYLKIGIVIDALCVRHMIIRFDCNYVASGLLILWLTVHACTSWIVR